MSNSDRLGVRYQRTKINAPNFRHKATQLYNGAIDRALLRHGNPGDSKSDLELGSRLTEQLGPETSPGLETTPLQTAALQTNTTSFFFSLQAPATLSGTAFQDEDIIFYDAASQSFSTHFDGSDVGLSNLEIDAFDIISDTEILLSFKDATTIGGLSVDDSDIVLFTASQLGDTTAGSFSLFLDGSDVGLTTNGEDIDGVQLLEDGSVLVSTTGSARVTGLSSRSRDEDILQFTPTSTGNNTSGTWSLYLDGSDIGLANASSEEIGALAVDSSGNLHLSTIGTFSVPNASGNDEDIVVFQPSSTGSNTSGSFEPNLFVDGSNLGITGDIRGLDLAIGFSGSDPGNPPPPPPPESTFDIEINFLDNSLSASQQAVFTDAAERWEEVIIEDVPDVFVTGIGLVDDVVIDVGAPDIDGVGGILGQAGPTVVRSDTFLPAVGIMEFDAADVDNLEADGLLEDVILHEMGHVLGIGTLWDLNGLVVDAGTADPRYVGPQATAEYNSLFGLNESSVPVANTGGPGTRDAHWRESVFGNELMTGFIDAGENPLSRITIASLADIGYEVNLDAADPYFPPALVTGGQLTASNVAGTSPASFSEEPLLGDSTMAEMLPPPEVSFV